VRADFDNAAIRHADDAVAVPDSGETVGNDDHGAAFDNVPHIGLDDTFEVGEFSTDFGVSLCLVEVRPP
jgi:hypothetical protein